jgi:RNA-directed DNA polymerase
VDGIKSLTPNQRFTLVENLGKLPIGRPTRRVWIPKAGSDEKRPLSIPTIHDRAAQAVVKLVMEPEWEAKFEPNSYGFRPGRGAHDAIGAIFTAIEKQPKYVLDADIAKCFDRIDHDALLNKTETFPTLKRLIKRWLKAGVLDGEVFTETEAGTPQGGILSPLLANIALHGLENHICSHFPNRIWVKTDGKKEYIHWRPQVIRYADDLAVLHRDRSVIETCQRLVAEWLAGMGLELSQKKTRIAHTLEREDGEAGFNFLGFNIRQFRVSKYNAARGRDFKTLIKPSKEAIKRHHAQLSETISCNKAAKQINLIGLLNPIIIGWSNYYRAVVSKRTFQLLDNRLYQKLRRWAYFRHPKKSRQWIARRYWAIGSGAGWVFGGEKGVVLKQHSSVPIIRHVKVKGTASPYNGDWCYWAGRRGAYPGVPHKLSLLLKQQKGRCQACKLYIRSDDLIEIHHLNGEHHDNRYINLIVVHRHCHDEIHGGQHELYRELGARDKRPLN